MAELRSGVQRVEWNIDRSGNLANSGGGPTWKQHCGMKSFGVLRGGKLGGKLARAIGGGSPTSDMIKRRR